MDRKEACEQVILLPSEKRLLDRIRRKPGLQCTDEDIETLLEYDLVEPEYEMMGGFTLPVPTNRYRVSEFYSVYAAYRHRERLDYIADKWIDILASFISLVSLVISVAALMQ